MLQMAGIVTAAGIFIEGCLHATLRCCAGCVAPGQWRLQATSTVGTVGRTFLAMSVLVARSLQSQGGETNKRQCRCKG